MEIIINARELYNNLGFLGQWYVGKSDGRPIEPRGVDEHVGTQRAWNYQREREDWREKRGTLRKWELDSIMSHAADVFGLKNARLERASSIARVIYDKGYHGGNWGKDDKLTLDERQATEKCLLCGLADSADHWLHMCSFTGLRAIRDAVISSLQLHVTAGTTASETQLHFTVHTTHH